MSQDDISGRLDKLIEKHDGLSGQLHSIDKRLEKYNAELEFHVARTNELQDMVVPVHEWMLKWQGVGQLVMWASVAIGMIGGLAWLWTK